MAALAAPRPSYCSGTDAYRSDVASQEQHDDELEVLRSIFPCDFVSGAAEQEKVPPCAAAMLVAAPTARVVSLQITPDLGDVITSLWLAVPSSTVAASIRAYGGYVASAASTHLRTHASHDDAELPAATPLLFRATSAMPSASSSTAASPDAAAASASASSSERHRIIRVRHLPPVTLTAALTGTYASGAAPPLVCVRALWLTEAARAAIIEQLRAMWSDGSATSGACLFAWADWLRTSLIPFLLACPDSAISLQLPLSRRVAKLLPVRESPFAFFYDADPDASAMYTPISADADASRSHTCLVLSNADLPSCGTAEQLAAASLEGQLLRLPQVVDALLDYDTFALQQHWIATEHDCSICLNRRLGSLCVRLRSCGHVFCRACLRDHVAALVAARSAPDAACPDPDCARPIPPADIEVICGIARAELYMAYLQGVRARVEAADGLLRCARAWCGSYVEVSTSSCRYIKCFAQRMKVPYGALQHSFGRDRRVKFCEACKNTECVECGAAWHGVQPCMMFIDNSEALIAASTELLQLGYHRAAIQDRVFPAPPPPVPEVPAQQPAAAAPQPDVELRRAKMLFGDMALVGDSNADAAFAVDASYDIWADVELWHAAAEKHAEGAMDAIKQAAWLAQFTRKCPSCGVLTEKVTGCNHMNCAHCGTHFCWLCGKAIAGYGHFGECKGGGTFDSGSAVAVKISGKDLLEML